MNYIEKIIKIMDKKRISQKEICTALDISTSTFSNWKNRNTDPPAKYLKPICNYIGISYSSLIEESSDEANATSEAFVTVEDPRTINLSLHDALIELNNKYHTIETQSFLMLNELPVKDKLELMMEISVRSVGNNLSEAE